MESWSDWVESEKAESDGEKNDAKNNVNGIWTEKWINMSEKLYTMFKILSKKKKDDARRNYINDRNGDSETYGSVSRFTYLDDDIMREICWRYDADDSEDIL